MYIHYTKSGLDPCVVVVAVGFISSEIHFVLIDPELEIVFFLSYSHRQCQIVKVKTRNQNLNVNRIKFRETVRKITVCSIF